MFVWTLCNRPLTPPCNESRNSHTRVVFNGRMKRVVLILAATAMAALMLPALASARDIQLGVTSSPLVAPTCPADAQGNSCKIVLTQVTAYEKRRDGVVNPTLVRQSGELVSFSLGLAGTNTVTAKDMAYLNKQYGGQPEAQLTVLQPTGTAKLPSFRVAAQSPLFKLRPSFGQVAEFPLTAPLPVVRGEIVALTIPTWAPVLSFELATGKFSYAQSRSPLKSATTGTTSCTVPAAGNLAQMLIGELSDYACSFPGTRVEYSVLEVTTPLGYTGELRKRALAKRR